jgi:hypothetical protein
MSFVDVPKPSGEPPEQLRGAAKLQRAKAAPWNSGRPMRLASWSPTKPPLEVRPVGARHALAGRGTYNRKHI